MNEMVAEFNTTSKNEANTTQENGSVHVKISYYMPLTVFSIALCVTGLVGNVIVFWLLCLKMKRTHFTIYVLNLAVADFTFLFAFCASMVYNFCVLNGVKTSNIVEYYVAYVCELLYNFGFNASMYLLMVIAMERCLAVLHPLWYQCHRPLNLSLCVSILCWLLSMLVTGLEHFLCKGSQHCTNVYFFTSALYIVVVLVMVVASLTLLITIQMASKYCHPPKLYIVVVISVTIFLISVIPVRILGLLLYFNVLQSKTLNVLFFFITSLCSAFNCSANPYVYMAVGKWHKCRKEDTSMINIFENMFKDAMESKNAATNTTNNSNIIIYNIQHVS
ncbi:mas-related G-protein coupled receptor member H-like [Gastrophryne carolinensis]